MSPIERFDDERGLVLATVLMLLLVLTLATYSGAMLSRTDVQLVNNEQHAKKALYVADAGVAEAMLRLGLASATNVTVDGQTFDASFTAPNFKPNTAWTDWNAQILFSGSAPVLSVHTVTTPTLQLAGSTRLPYSVAAGGADPPLTIKWDLCPSVNVAAGCPTAGAIRKINGQNVLDIVSTGQWGTARRTVTALVTNTPSTSILTLSGACNRGITLNGTSSVINVSGSIQVNGTCSGAVSGSGSPTMTAGGPINVVGGVSLTTPPTPTPTTGAAAMSDPLAATLPPCFGLNVTSCQTISPAPSQQGIAGPTTPATRIVSSGTLNPGIYYGGLDIRGTLTMNPGVYIMAGGGFSVTRSGTTLNATGVTIYNTQNDNPSFRSGAGGFGQVIAQNATLNWTAPTASTASNPFASIAVFQDRSNTQDLSFLGASLSGTIDGTIYSPSADMTLQRGTLDFGTVIVSTLTVQNGADYGSATTQLTTGGLRLVGWKDFQ